MHIDFLDDPDCAVLRIEGPVHPDSGVRWYDAVRGDPRYRPGLALVFDVSDADFTEVTTEVLQGYLQHLKAYVTQVAGDEPVQPVAIVAADDLAFGMGRMFSAMASAQEERPRAVFRNLEDARAWLRDRPAQS